MNEIVACCGLLCQICSIYLATREIDTNKKEKMIYEIIDMCKEHYGVDYQYEDINDCDGCNSKNDKIFFGCANCNVRKCVIKKGIKNCAYCDEYACEKLLKIFKTDSAAKTRLDIIRSKI